MSTLLVEDVGRGRTLCFAHSFLCDSSQWDPQFAALGRSYRILRSDLWGHGRGPLDQPPADLDGIAQAHGAALDAAGASRCVLVASSIGGMWGLRLALARPDLIAGIVLIGSAAGPEPTASRLRYTQML